MERFASQMLSSVAIRTAKAETIQSRLNLFNCGLVVQENVQVISKNTLLAEKTACRTSNVGVLYIIHERLPDVVLLLGTPRVGLIAVLLVVACRWPSSLRDQEPVTARC